MSKLEELIKEFCPNGVEYVKIGSVVNYEQPSKYLVKKADYKEEYSTPVLTAGQTFILGYTNEMNGIYNASKDSPVIIFDDFTGAFKWVDFPFKVKSSAIKFLKANEKRAMLRYIFHVMGNINLTSTEHKRLWIGIYSELQIPLPALPVQREIVRVLDSFTLYSAELTAELTARRKQYEFYRDKLLDFENFVEKRKLEECCKILDNKRKPITQSARVAGIYPYYGANGIQDYVAEYLFDGEFILVGEDGSVITENGNPIITWAVGKIWVNNHAHIIQNNGKVNFRFLFHYLHIIDIKKLVHGNIPKLTGKDFKELQIPIPPMEVQERIVKVLDNFDAICSDLGIGLPAEIEKRQKQYEYYREKLLTFDVKYATILTERNGTERNGTERNGTGRAD